MRLKSLAGLVIGQHLKLAAAETKNGRPCVAAVSHGLTPYIDRRLQVCRRVPLTANPTPATVHTGKYLWVDCRGRPMSSSTIRAQIKLRTRRTFSNGIWPHLFRDCAVTELVDSAPDQIGIAPDLLGHADLRTTRKHYIRAQGMAAHRRSRKNFL